MGNKPPVVLCSTSSPTEATLNLEDGDVIAVGSGEWADWLEQNVSFRFESGFGGADSFTARKHSRKTGDFWYAYRKLGKELGNCYLGKSEALTVERMLAIASRLSEVPIAKPEFKVKQAKTSYASECTTEICLTNELGKDDNLDAKIQTIVDAALDRKLAEIEQRLGKP